MPQPRNGSFDYAKLFAACGIVWFHTHAPGAAYGYAGLAFFLILLVVFTLPAAQQFSFAGFTRTRLWRLLVPWALSCLFYGALKLGEVWATAATLDSEFSASMLLTGPALHLWFLPFAFVAGLVIYPLSRVALALPTHLRLPLAMFFAALTLVGLSLPLPQALPLAQWVYALPALGLGLALMFIRTQAVLQLGLIGSIGVVGLAADWGGTMQLVLAGLLLVLCTALPAPATARSALAGRISLTVYLLHPAVVTVLHRATNLTSATVVFALLAIGVTVALAGIINLWMRRAGVTPWLPFPRGITQA